MVRNISLKFSEQVQQLLARQSQFHPKDDGYRLYQLDGSARLNRRYISFSNIWLKSMHWASPGGRHCGANNPQRPAARSIHCGQYQSSSRNQIYSKLLSKRWIWPAYPVHVRQSNPADCACPSSFVDVFAIHQSRKGPVFPRCRR